jgi:hypothetical protein
MPYFGGRSPANRHDDEHEHDPQTSESGFISLDGCSIAEKRSHLFGLP